MDLLKERLDIPYTKLKFYLVFEKATILPRDKVSALRGGMGEMLLRQNCIADRNCRECLYMQDCIVHRTLYTQMKKKPAFMQGEDSVGYLIECENYQEQFEKGEELYFYLILFGRNMVYFGQYLQAFYQLGVCGLGKYKAKFFIKEIRNTKGQAVLYDNQVDMRQLNQGTVYDYVWRRMEELEENGCDNRLVFHTPLSLKYHGEYINEFLAEPVINAIFRRIVMLDYFVDHYLDAPYLEEYPVIMTQSVKTAVVSRYSSTQGTKNHLRGIKGNIQFQEIDEKLLHYILAGELLHIGRNSSFGFGHYRLY